MSGVYDKSTAVWMAALTALINFLCNFAGVYLVEKMGRRLLTLASLAGVIASLAVLAIGFQVGAANAPRVGFYSNEASDTGCTMYENCNGCITSDNCGFCFEDLKSGANGSCIAAKEDYTKGSLTGWCVNGTKADEKLVWAKDWCPSNYSWMTLFGLCMYLLFFGPGMGPMPWTINSEIYPLWARSVCFSTATAFNWFFNMLISLTFLTLTEHITKQGAFWLYASFGAVGFVYFFLQLPETKGKSLEDTAALFGGGGKEESRRSSRVDSKTSDVRKRKSNQSDSSRPI